MINNVGDVLIAPYNSNGKDVVNLTEKLTISGMCKEFQWSSNNSNTLLLEYCKKGDSKVCSISFDPNNPFSTDINELGNFKLDPRVERGDYKYTQDFVSSTLNNQDYSFLNIGSVDRFEYSTSDEITSYYWFAHPNPEKNNHRTLLLCQGGPHHAWEPEVECGTYHIPLLQHLGYTIIMPIVRGMPGISQEFDDQVRGDWGGQCIKDYLAALDTAIKDHDLDENNVAVLGHSFGGFCAYSMNVQHPERFRCVVSESGPFNLESFLSDSKEPGPIEGSIKNQTMKCEMYNGLANPQGKKVADKMIREQSPHNLIKNCKGFRPISYRKNKGKGYAIKYAIKYCNFDSILIMDADLSVGLENIELFYNQCSQGNMIIGTRVYNKSKRSKIRRFISFCSNICVHKLIGVSVKDSQCGFKMFNIQDYNKISKYLRSNRWLLDMELLLYQKSQGVNIIEIPVDWKNDPDSTLKGKEAIKSSLRELIIILKERKANVKEIKDL